MPYEFDTTAGFSALTIRSSRARFAASALAGYDLTIANAAQRPGLAQALGGTKETSLFALLELIAGITEMIFSWRLVFGLGLTICICLALVGALPNDTLRWIVCVPIGLAGTGLSFWWQISADKKG